MKTEIIERYVEIATKREPHLKAQIEAMTAEVTELRDELQRLRKEILAASGGKTGVWPSDGYYVVVSDKNVSVVRQGPLE